MALHIVAEAKPERLAQELSTEIKLAGGADLEAGDIEKRVSRQDAERYLLEWKKIVLEYERTGGSLDSVYAGEGGGIQSRLLGGDNNEALEGLKDKHNIKLSE